MSYDEDDSTGPPSVLRGTGPNLVTRPRAIMDLLSVVGNLASVAGLAVSCYTLYMVQSLPEALRHHSRTRQVTDLIDKINRVSTRKPRITEKTILEVELIVHTARLFYVSENSSRSRHLRTLLDDLEAELRGEGRL
jgi:hypothetical protein